MAWPPESLATQSGSLPLRRIRLVVRGLPEEHAVRIALGEDHLRAQGVDVIDGVHVVRAIDRDRDAGGRLDPIDGDLRGARDGQDGRQREHRHEDSKPLRSGELAHRSSRSATPTGTSPARVAPERGRDRAALTDRSSNARASGTHRASRAPREERGRSAASSVELVGRGTPVRQSRLTRARPAAPGAGVGGQASAAWRSGQRSSRARRRPPSGPAAGPGRSRVPGSMEPAGWRARGVGARRGAGS